MTFPQRRYNSNMYKGKELQTVLELVMYNTCYNAALINILYNSETLPVRVKQRYIYTFI